MAALRCLLLLLCGAALGPAVHLDFAEHRSQAAKIKVNPRGNLWATGTAGREDADTRVRGRSCSPLRAAGTAGGRRRAGQGWGSTIPLPWGWVLHLFNLSAREGSFLKSRVERGPGISGFLLSCAG